jgi:hypothetical protein
VHAKPATSHPTWLLHRAILHALVAPLVALYRRAAFLASQVPSHPTELELVFNGAARDAFVWMQAFVESETDWCTGAGCPACLTQAAIQDEGMVRLLLAGLEMAEQEDPRSARSTSGDSEGTSYPFPTGPGKFSLVVESEEPLGMLSDDTATESEDNDDLSESDLDLCRFSSTSSLATSIAGSPPASAFPMKLPSSPFLLPQRHAPRTRNATSAPSTEPVPMDNGPPTLPSLGFFRSSLLEALAADGFFSLSTVMSRGTSLTAGLRALIEACREMEVATVVAPTPVETEPAEPVASSHEQPSMDEQDDEEDVPIDISRFKWVDEKDLLEKRRRRQQELSSRYMPDTPSDAEDEHSSSNEEDEEDEVDYRDETVHEGDAALDRLVAGWGMRQVWVRAGLGQIDVRERRRILGAIEDRAGKLRALSSRDRRRRGASGAF